MKDVFLGTEEEEDREEGEESKKSYYDEFGFDDSRRSNSARLTQGWLEEARHVLASSSPNSSNSRKQGGSSVVGSPRFAASPSSLSQGRNNVPLLMSLDRRDPLSRSARRKKGGENLGDEILSKSSSKHTHNNSFTSPSSSPSSHDHGHGHGFDSIDPLCRRKSRFQTQTLNPNAPNPNLFQTLPHKFSPHSPPPPHRNNQIQSVSSSSFSSDSLDNAKDSNANQTLYQPTLPEAYEVPRILKVEAKLISPPSTSPDAKSKAELQGFRGKSKFFFARWFGFAVTPTLRQIHSTPTLRQIHSTPTSSFPSQPCPNGVAPSLVGESCTTVSSLTIAGVWLSFVILQTVLCTLPSSSLIVHSRSFSQCWSLLLSRADLHD
ncbi:hypothetical protein PIB30_022422 [Stylosanthes scabra]|uniref:Uncharacterized protein n=1 Tax=Stylosanthes scabra TaxID=79078 RepID=A0ABU6Q9G2_9FABA|nr:hypothetical protein [Stylosanthes scabra]